jgi:predicted AlkP superfamily phosphohydrolase/phosphomutase
MVPLRASWLQGALRCIQIFRIACCLFAVLHILEPAFAEEKERLLLVCVDGADWEVMMPLVKEGDLPNISDMMREGSYGRLICEPPSSPPSWTSIATGKVSGKHGIEGFGSTARKTKAIWNILSQRGRKVVVINWLMASPLEEINGAMFSPFLEVKGGRRNLETLYRPRSLKEEIEGKIKLAEVPPFSEVELYRFMEPSDDNLIKISQYMLKRYNPQFCFIGFLGTNPYQHRYWSAREPSFFDISKEEVGKKGKLIESYYKKVDKFLGQFLNKDYNIIFVSDHGFARNDLRAGPRIVRYYRLNSDMQHINFLFNLMLYRLGLLVFDRQPSIFFDTDIAVKIDFSKSKARFFNAYAQGTQGVRLINSTAEEFEALRERLYQILKGAHFETGESVFKQVRKTALQRDDAGAHISFKLNPIFKRENLIFDDTEQRHLDFKYLMDKQGNKLRKIILEKDEYNLADFIDFSLSGGHQIEGVIIMYGPLIKKAGIIQGAKNFDVAPTVLYLSGIPVGRDMDGKVLIEAIRPEFLKRNPINYVSTHDREGESYRISTFILDEEVKEKLRSLGYLN